MKNIVPIALLSALLLSACGGDDDSGSGGDKPPQPQEQPAQGASACLDSWNAATPDVRAQASLSHRGDEPKDVYVGTYSGEAFSATGDFYDASGSTDSTDISVAPGDCVAVDRTGSNDEETNWVMVAPKANGGGKSWYFVDETGDSPLAESPQPLEGEQVVGIVGFGEEAKLQP